MNASQVTKERINANGQGPSTGSKRKRKWLLPLLIVGGVVLLAGTATGIVLGVKNCKPDNSDQDNLTPLQKAKKYLTDHPRNNLHDPGDRTKDWTEKDNQDMLNYFNSSLFDLPRLVDGLIWGAIQFTEGAKMSNDLFDVEMTDFSAWVSANTHEVKLKVMVEARIGRDGNKVPYQGWEGDITDNIQGYDFGIEGNIAFTKGGEKTTYNPTPQNPATLRWAQTYTVLTKHIELSYGFNNNDIGIGILNPTYTKEVTDKVPASGY